MLQRRAFHGVFFEMARRTPFTKGRFQNAYGKRTVTTQRQRFSVPGRLSCFAAPRKPRRSLFLVQAAIPIVGARGDDVFHALEAAVEAVEGLLQPLQRQIARTEV